MELKSKEEILEIIKKLEIPKRKAIEIDNEKDILKFFKKCEMDDFNFRYIINEGLQKIKIFLIDKYWDYENRSSIEQLFDNINEVILEILQTDGNNLEKELIFKILNFESEIIDF